MHGSARKKRASKAGWQASPQARSASAQAGPSSPDSRYYEPHGSPGQYGMLEELLAASEGHMALSVSTDRHSIRQKVEEFLLSLPLGTGPKSAHIEDAVATQLYDVELTNAKLVRKLQQWAAVAQELQSIIQQQQHQLQHQQPHQQPHHPHAGFTSSTPSPTRAAAISPEQLSTAFTAAAIAQSFVASGARSSQQPQLPSPVSISRPLEAAHAAAFQERRSHSPPPSWPAGQYYQQQGGSPSVAGSSYRPPATPSAAGSNLAAGGHEYQHSREGIDAAALFASQQAEMQQLQDQTAALRAQLGARNSDALLQELDLVVAERNGLADDAKQLRVRVAGLVAELAEAKRVMDRQGTKEEEQAQVLREDLEVSRVQLSEQKRLVALGKEEAQRLRKALLDAEMEVQSMCLDHEAGQRKVAEAQEMADHIKAANAKLLVDTAQERSRAAGAAAALEEEQRETGRLRQEVKELVEQLEASNNEVDQKLQHVREVETRWGTAEREVGELQGVCEELQHAVEQLQDRMTGKELEHEAALQAQVFRCKELQETHKQLLADYNACSAAHEELQAQQQILQAELQETQDALQAELQKQQLSTQVQLQEQQQRLQAQLQEQQQHTQAQLQEQQQASQAELQSKEELVVGLRDQLAVLQARGLEMEQEALDLQQQVSHLHTRGLELEQQAAVATQEAQQAAVQHVSRVQQLGLEHKEAYDGVSAQLTESEGQLQEAKRQLEEIRLAFRKVQETAGQSAEQLVATETEKEQLQHAVEAFQQQGKALEEELQLGLAREALLNKQVEELEARCMLKDDQLEDLAASVAEVQDGLEGARAAVQTERQAAGSLQQQCDDLAVKLEQAVGEHAGAERRWEELKQVVEEERRGWEQREGELSRAVADLEDRVEAACARAEEAEARVLVLESLLREARAESSAAARQLQAELDAGLAEVALLRTEAGELSQERSSLHHTVEQLHEANKKLEASKDAASDEAAALSTQLQDAQQQLEQLQRQHEEAVAELQARLHDIEHQSSSKQAAAETYWQHQREVAEQKHKDAMEEAEAELKRADCEQEELRGRLGEAEAQLQEAVAAAKLAQDGGIEATTAAQLRAEQQVRQLREEVEQQKGQLQAALDQAEKERAAAQQLASELGTLLASTNKEADELRAQRAEMEKQLQEAQAGVLEAKAAAEQLAAMAEEAVGQRDVAQEEREQWEQHSWQHEAQVQEQLQEAMAALDRLAEENALLEQRAHAAEQAAGEASRAGEQQLMSQQMVVEELTARLEGAEGKLEGVEKLGEAQGRVVELERQVGEKGAEVQALEAKLLELQHQASGLEILLREERSKSSPNLKHQLTLLQAQLSQSHVDLQAARKAADDREAELAATRQQHATDHARLTADIAAARRENAQLALKVDEASVLVVSQAGAANPELLDQLAASRREAARLARELEEQRAGGGGQGDMARLAADVAALRRENGQLALELEEAKALASGRVRAASQLSDTLAEVQELSSQLAEARQQVRDHQRAAAELAEVQRQQGRGVGGGAGGAGGLEELQGARQQVRELTAALAEAQYEAGGFQQAADTALEQVQGIDSQLREMQAALERALDRAFTAERAAKEAGELRAQVAQGSAAEAQLRGEVAALQRALQRADEQVQRLEERAAQVAQQAQVAAADAPAGGGARTAKRMQDLLYSREKELRRTQERVHQLQGQISSVSSHGSTPRAGSPGRSMSLGAVRSHSFAVSDSEDSLARSASLASPTTPEGGSQAFQPSSPVRAAPQRTLSDPGKAGSPVRGNGQDAATTESSGRGNASAASAREGAVPGGKGSSKKAASRLADPAKRICCYDTSASDFYSDSD